MLKQKDRKTLIDAKRDMEAAKSRLEDTIQEIAESSGIDAPVLRKVVNAWYRGTHRNLRRGAQVTLDLLGKETDDIQNDIFSQSDAITQNEAA